MTMALSPPGRFETLLIVIVFHREYTERPC